MDMTTPRFTLLKTCLRFILRIYLFNEELMENISAYFKKEQLFKTHDNHRNHLDPVFYNDYPLSPFLKLKKLYSSAVKTEIPLFFFITIIYYTYLINSELEIKIPSLLQDIATIKKFDSPMLAAYALYLIGTRMSDSEVNTLLYSKYPDMFPTLVEPAILPFSLDLNDYNPPKIVESENFQEEKEKEQVENIDNKLDATDSHDETTIATNHDEDDKIIKIEDSAQHENEVKNKKRATKENLKNERKDEISPNILAINEETKIESDDPDNTQDIISKKSFSKDAENEFSSENSTVSLAKKSDIDPKGNKTKAPANKQNSNKQKMSKGKSRKKINPDTKPLFQDNSQKEK
jgi:hypothetical protein